MPVVQHLQADVANLKQQLLAQSLPPEQLVSIVVRSLRSMADTRASSGEEERYSHVDLDGFAANLQAAQKVIDLMRAAAGQVVRRPAGEDRRCRRGPGRRIQRPAQRQRLCHLRQP